jgi:undecaprenyl-diphosphatase
VMKALFGRERPPVTLHEVSVGLAAFPSAHATDAAAFFGAAALTLALAVARHRWVKALLLVGAAALAGLVGLSRLVLAVHWLSDVVAGWALGTAVATAVVMSAWFATSARPEGSGDPRNTT